LRFRDAFQHFVTKPSLACQRWRTLGELVFTVEKIIDYSPASTFSPRIVAGDSPPDWLRHRIADFNV
jgi:hypothetical protein